MPDAARPHDAARPRDAAPPAEDAATPVPTVDAGPKLGPFGPPVVLAGFDRADDPSLTMDGLELYFDGVSSEQIFFTTRERITDPWGPHQALITPDFDGFGTTPSITPDGLELHFASNRLPGAGMRDIWSLRRETRTSEWLAPTRLTPLNSEDQDYAPGLSSSGLELVLTRSGGAFPTEDLFLASRQTVSAEWGTPRPLALSKPERRESDAVFANSDLELWFVASTENQGTDLFVAVRDSIDAEFGNEQPVSELNSEFNEGDPWLSHDGREILFFSTRSGEMRLYRATR